jgi:hypothetical protein
VPLGVLAQRDSRQLLDLGFLRAELLERLDELGRDDARDYGAVMHRRRRSEEGMPAS